MSISAARSKQGRIRRAVTIGRRVKGIPTICITDDRDPAVKRIISLMNNKGCREDLLSRLRTPLWESQKRLIITKNAKEESNKPEVLQQTSGLWFPPSQEVQMPDNGSRNVRQPALLRKMETSDKWQPYAVGMDYNWAICSRPAESRYYGIDKFTRTVTGTVTHTGTHTHIHIHTHTHTL